MTRTTGSLRLFLAILALLALVAVIALPVLAADPSGSPSPVASEPSGSIEPSASTEPSPTDPPAPTPAPTAAPASEATSAPDDDGGTQMPEQPPKPAKDKPDKAKGEPVTMTGVVGSRTDADGQVEYTLSADGTVVVLDAGPPWYLGDDHPLADSVGKRVTIAGTQRAGEDEVDVETVDGQPIREPGKPPWAGGWKVVGERHPGWSEEKAARAAERAAAKAERNAAKAAQHGTTCWPPGQCKDASAADATATNPPGD